MKIKYLGKKSNLDLTMPYLYGGPYHIEGPGDVIEIMDADWPELKARNPIMFAVQGAETPELPGDAPNAEDVDEAKIAALLEQSGLAPHVEKVESQYVEDPYADYVPPEEEEVDVVKDEDPQTDPEPKEPQPAPEPEKKKPVKQVKKTPPPKKKKVTPPTETFVEDEQENPEEK